MNKFIAFVSAILLSSSFASAEGKKQTQNNSYSLQANQKAGDVFPLKEDHYYTFDVKGKDKAGKMECYLLVAKRIYIADTRDGNSCHMEMNTFATGEYMLVIFNKGKAQKADVSIQVIHPENEGAEKAPEKKEEKRQAPTQSEDKPSGEEAKRQKEEDEALGRYFAEGGGLN